MRNHKLSLTCILARFAALFCWSMLCRVGDVHADEGADPLENLGLVYRDGNSELLQELWLLGRYHSQYHWSEGSTGEDHGHESRRTRLGFQGRALKSMTVHAQMVSGSDINPFYNGFTELWMQWQFSPSLAVTLGQQKHRFTHDRNVSSRYLNYLERAALTNMFNADYTPAVTLQGTINKFSYYTGLFSNSTGQNMGDAFTELNSGYSLLAAGYYDLSDVMAFDSFFLYTSYLHSSFNDNATNLNRFTDGLSAALILTSGARSLVTEVTGGWSDENGNATGLNLQPGIFLTEKLQLVGRYQGAISNRSDGLVPQRRYEQPSGLRSGERYQALYLGANYYLAQHRIKLLGGVEYSLMDKEDVWTFSTAFRFYFGPHSGGAFPMNQLLPGDVFGAD